jgi:RimJ/RimL family protein N-acetyltransferase
MFVRGRRASRLYGQCRGPLHIVRTPSLLLRTATPREAQIAMACASDDDAQRWPGWVDDICPEAGRAALIASHADGLEQPGRPVLSLPGRMIAIDPEQMAVIGDVGITAKQAEPPHIGGWLAPSYRGRGLGRELFTAALDLGHRHLGIEVLRAGAETSNTASRRSLEAAGFLPARGTANHRLPDGRTVPTCWYEHIASTSRCRGTGWS